MNKRIRIDILTKKPGNGTNEFNFGALAAGMRQMVSGFRWLGTSTEWWTSTKQREDTLYAIAMSTGPLLYDGQAAVKNYGYYVRCVRD